MHIEGTDIPPNVDRELERLHRVFMEHDSQQYREWAWLGISRIHQMLFYEESSTPTEFLEKTRQAVREAGEGL